MELKSLEVNIFAFPQGIDHGIQIPQGDAEFVLGQARRDELMGMGVDARIDAQAHVGYHAHPFGQAIQDRQFFHRFHIKGLDAQTQAGRHLGVRLPYPRKHDPGRLEATFEGADHLVAAHTVGPESTGRKDFHHPAAIIGFHRIVDMDVIAAAELGYRIGRLLQQRHIIIIKRGPDAPERVFVVNYHA